MTNETAVGESQVKRREKRLRKTLLLLADIVFIVLSQMVALLIEKGPAWQNLGFFFHRENALLFFFVPITLLIFYVFRLYSSVWSFASVAELVYTSIACSLATVAQAAGMFLAGKQLPVAYHVLYLFFLTFSVACVRFSYRLVRRWRQWRVSGGGRSRTIGDPDHQRVGAHIYIHAQLVKTAPVESSTGAVFLYNFQTVFIRQCTGNVAGVI